MKFPHSISIPVINHLTGRTYTLIRASHLNPATETFSQITEICNEPEIYHWLFRDLLAGKRYTEEKAQEWLSSASQGWAAQTHFVFVVINEHEQVAAACDIKSGDPIPEIGYWASRHHRGIMTNAVRAMSTLARAAGFTGLFARVKIENNQSQAVLKRCGFQNIESDEQGYLHYELLLNES